MATAIIWAATALGITALVVHAALSGWRGWLELRRDEMMAHPRDPTGQAPGTRIEIADLRERLRRLEAIARGVEL